MLICSSLSPPAGCRPSSPLRCLQVSRSTYSELSITVFCISRCWAGSASQDGNLACDNEEHACAWLAFHDDNMPSLHRALLQHKVELSEMLPGVAAFKDSYLSKESQLLSCSLELQSTQPPGMLPYFTVIVMLVFLGQLRHCCT